MTPGLSLQSLSQVMYTLESNDARAQSAKSEPSHVHPAKQTKPTPGSSLQRLDQVRSLEINDARVKSAKIRPSHVDTHK